MATIGWFLQGFIEDRKRIQLPVDSPLRHKPNKAILQEVIGTSGQVLEAFSPSDLARHFRRRRHATYDELIYRMYMAFKDYGPSSYNYSHEAIFQIPPDYVVEGDTPRRKSPEVRIWRLRNQSCVRTRPPSTSTPHCPAC
jgi:hypothetical protein